MLLSPVWCHSSTSSNDHFHAKIPNAVFHPTLPTPFKGEGEQRRQPAAAEERWPRQQGATVGVGTLAAALRSQWTALDAAARPAAFAVVSWWAGRREVCASGSLNKNYGWATAPPWCRGEDHSSELKYIQINASSLMRHTSVINTHA